MQKLLDAGKSIKDVAKGGTKKKNNNRVPSSCARRNRQFLSLFCNSPRPLDRIASLRAPATGATRVHVCALRARAYLARNLYKKRGTLGSTPKRFDPLASVAYVIFDMCYILGKETEI